MLENLIAQLEEIAENDELFAVMAKLYKKAYDALIEAGFTEEQALTIVANQGSGINNIS